MWWWATRGPAVLPFLLEEAGHVAGYGIILADGDEGWLSGGLLPDARDRGLGTLLFTALCLLAKQEGLRPVLEVLKSNPRAEQVYRKLGFVQIRETDKVYVMEHPQ
jgi:GNAT superfamily N-acetyltransferase